MIRTIAFIVVALAACSKDKPNTTPTGGGDMAATGSGDNPETDPTMPSWAPPSCTEYNKLVTQIGECNAIDQGERDAVKTQYEARLVEWKALQNTEQAQLDAVKKQCDDAVAELGPKKTAGCP